MWAPKIGSGQRRNKIAFSFITASEGEPQFPVPNDTTLLGLWQIVTVRCSSPDSIKFYNDDSFNEVALHI